MSKKKTLADLMDNDFFIDFDNTEEKAKRKQLAESLKSKRTLTESVEEPEVESCYKRIVASATEEKNRVINNPDDAMIAVEVSKEHLKKALKLGAFSAFAGEGPFTVPAQYVESVDLEFSNNIILDEDNSLLSVQLHGEYNGESLNDYIDGVCFVQFRDYPAFDTEEEALEFFEKEIRPNATKIAEEMIDEAWAESGYKDYEGITDISDNDNEENDEDDDIEDGGTDGGKLIKADFNNWETLIETADSLLAGLAHSSGNDDYDDGDGYWVTEYTKWCNRYIYYTDKLNNEADLDKLCNEYSEKLPGVTFYYNIDTDEELCEIGYEANKQVEESVEEPDNAVVDCKVNKVITHCEDEKPVDCLGEKKPLEKPLTEQVDKLQVLAWCTKNCADFFTAVITNAPITKQRKLNRAAYKAMKDRFGLEGKEAEDLMSSGFALWKRLYWTGTNESLKEARSSADIRAEIERLQKELADAEAAEKKASYNSNVPTEVWIYDMYINPADKGTWTSAELYNGKYDGYVYETADKAIRGGLAHLNELADEGELEGEPIDYTVEAINIPISEVDEETLSFSGLDHLI